MDISEINTTLLPKVTEEHKSERPTKKAMKVIILVTTVSCLYYFLFLIIMDVAYHFTEEE